MIKEKKVTETVTIHTCDICGNELTKNFSSLHRYSDNTPYTCIAINPWEFHNECVEKVIKDYMKDHE